MNLLLTQGNALRIPLEDESVHCVVTSPPYWGLRDYGTATWEGGDPKCDHKEPGGHGKTAIVGNTINDVSIKQYKNECKKCSAIRIDNQLGLEPTPELYVANMVAVFREVKRVLRADGTLWLNMGDSYATQPAGNKVPTGINQTQGAGKAGVQAQHGENAHRKDWSGLGLKPKDLCGIPWRVAFALQADGWWLRSDIIWLKPNPMPESVTDRPTKAHEYLFLMTKSARYYYDADAVREPIAEATISRNLYPHHGSKNAEGAYSISRDREPGEFGDEVRGRNKRTVWTIPTRSYSGAHFATYPPALVEPCIKAGTSERGVCPECGKPWERVIDVTYKNDTTTDGRPAKGNDRKGQEASGAMGYEERTRRITNTLGWQRTCECGTFEQPIPATVFDPFVGSGTTLQVARALGRNGVGLDLSLEYLHLARQRLSLDALEAWGKAKKDGTAVTDLPMFGGQDEVE